MTLVRGSRATNSTRRAPPRQQLGDRGRLVVDASDLESTWAARRGFRGTPWFLWVGADGRVAAVVTRAHALRGRLRELAGSAR